MTSTTNPLVLKWQRIDFEWNCSWSYSIIAGGGGGISSNWKFAKGQNCPLAFYCVKMNDFCQHHSHSVRMRGKIHTKCARNACDLTSPCFTLFYLLRIAINFSARSIVLKSKLSESLNNIYLIKSSASHQWKHTKCKQTAHFSSYFIFHFFLSMFLFSPVCFQF